MFSRYGWTRDYIYHDYRDHVGPYLPYSQWIDQLEAVIEATSRERRDKWQRAAFTGWHVYFFRKRYEGSPEPLGFGEYLDSFGLADPDADTGPTDEEIMESARQMMAQFGVEL